MTMLRALLSFETVFVLFLFAGVFKADPRFAWVPVDLTALFMAMSVVAGCWVVGRRGLRLPVVGARTVLLFALFAAYMGASLAWSAGPTYGGSKALYTATLVLWALAGAALVIAPDPRRVRRFLGLLGAFSVWIALESVLALSRAGIGGNLSALGGLYLGLGRVLGTGAVVFLAFGLLGDGSRRGHVGWLLLATALVGVMLLVGGRGPLLGVALAGGTLVVLGWRRSDRHIFAVRVRSLVLGGCLATAGIVIGVLASQGSTAVAAIRRLGALFDAVAGSSTAERLHYFASAMELWTTSPVLGHGVGSWPALAYSLDVRGYPHNLVLETLAELGLVGLLLLLAVTISAISGFRFRQAHRLRPTPVLLLMLLINVGFNAMVSGDLPDNRFLFTVLGLMTLSPPDALPRVFAVAPTPPREVV